MYFQFYLNIIFFRYLPMGLRVSWARLGADSTTTSPVKEGLNLVAHFIINCSRLPIGPPCKIKCSKFKTTLWIFDDLFCEGRVKNWSSFFNKSESQWFLIVVLWAGFVKIHCFRGPQKYNYCELFCILHSLILNKNCRLNHTIRIQSPRFFHKRLA